MRLEPSATGHLEEQVRQHLHGTREEDDMLVGFWVLDDYPGDVRPALELIHRLVEEENHLSRVPRFTVCGFGGLLESADVSPNRAFDEFDCGLVIYTPAGCDAVALYPYARGADATAESVDWSMRELLPHMLNGLRERGRDPTRHPLVGVPQAFGSPAAQFVTPRAQDVASQSEACCRAGATALLVYAWWDVGTDSNQQLGNSDHLQLGMADGIRRCRAYW